MPAKLNSYLPENSMKGLSAMQCKNSKLTIFKLISKGLIEFTIGHSINPRKLLHCFFSFNYSKSRRA